MYALTNNFRSWIEFSSKELEIACLKEAKRNFHVILSAIVEPLLQKVPPTLLLPASEVTPPPSPVPTTMVTSKTTLEVGSNSKVKKIVVSEEFIFKNLEHLVAENSEVKERIKHQDKKTSNIEGFLGEILSRLPPPP